MYNTMNDKDFNKAVDVKMYEICKSATIGQVDDLINKLKAYINPFDYSNITQIQRPAYAKMQEIVDIVQKGRKETKEIFLEFLRFDNSVVYNYVKEAIGVHFISPNPEMNTANYESRYTFRSMPRTSTRNDVSMTNRVENITLSDTHSSRSSPVRTDTSDVHSIVNRSDRSQYLIEFKMVISKIFHSLNENEKYNFKSWLLQKQYIERGTLSRCNEFDDLLYELEKRDMLNAFIHYTGYPNSLNLLEIQQKFNQIPKIICQKCNKEILEIV